MLHRIKTSLYALVAVVLVGWVTDALNEDLMFRLITRHFFPNAVAKYQYPFDNFTSTLIWGVPLLIGLLLMLVATVMTVHHIKKRHAYTLKKPKKMASVDSVIIATEPDRLLEAFTAYNASQHIHVLSFNKDTHPIVEAAADTLRNEGKHTVSLHSIPTTDDLHALVGHLDAVIKRITKKEQDLAFDLLYAPAIVSSAAMYCSLDTDMSLTYPKNDGILQYDTECEMEA